MMAMVVVSSCSGRCRCRRQSHQDAAAGRAHSSPHAPARARRIENTAHSKGVPSGRRRRTRMHRLSTAHPNWKAATFPLNMAEFIENNVTPVHVHVHVHVQVVTHHLTDRLTLYIALVRKIPVKKSCVGLLGIRRRRSSATRGNATWRSIARALAASTDSTTRVASAADTLMLIQLVPATGVARGH